MTDTPTPQNDGDKPAQPLSKLSRDALSEIYTELRELLRSDDAIRRMRMLSDPAQQGFMAPELFGNLCDELIQAILSTVMPIAKRDWAATQPEPKTGAEMIAAERQRQITEEGWTPEHDAQHDNNQLAYAATCYALPSDLRDYATPQPPHFWPWRDEDWKPLPHHRIRELVKAGGLIAAEIDRLKAR